MNFNDFEVFDRLRLPALNLPAPDLTVPREILRILGGQPFLRQIKAKHVIGNQTTLQFSFWKLHSPKTRVRNVAIRQTAPGLYTVEFRGWQRTQGTTLATHENVPAGELVALFEASTGFRRAWCTVNKPLADP